MNNEQAQLALENIGSKIKLELDEEMPTFSFENEAIGFVSDISIVIFATGGYLKHKLSDEEYSILVELSKTYTGNRIQDKTFNGFVNSLSKTDEPTRTKIINYVKELISKDNRRES
ncbi:MAG: hypothetical protein ABF536_03980 [Liquorilactobacillus mali]|uniref:hypothetical protein n=1 Tax=Liquorilactobacillus mali TaxID=1618 RepID=UPI0039ED1ABD